MRELDRTARVFFLTVIAAGTATGAAVIVSNQMPPPDNWSVWWTFAFLTSLAAISQVFNVAVVKNQASCISLAFLFAELMLVDYPLLVVSVVIMFIPDWIRNKRRHYVQTFNIAVFVLGALLARHHYLWVAGDSASGWRTVLAVAAAIVVFAAVNHTMLIAALRLGRGTPLRDSFSIALQSLVIDTGLAGLGASLALLWRIDPWLLIIGAYPLLLINRSLHIPNLRHAAITDPKTSLYNFKYFMDILHGELQRASRRSRPVALIMADLDLLRNVNNTYGHIAGDEVLTEVASIITSQIRHTDVAARFGGEEFIILLPETGPEQALAIANRIREHVANRLFTVSTADHPIRASLSVGVAVFPQHGTDANKLIHEADLAVRWAKINGRNRVYLAAPQIAELLARHSSEAVTDDDSWRSKWSVQALESSSSPTPNGTSRIRHLTHHLEKALRN